LERILSTLSATIVCPACSHENQPSDNFCSECGIEIRKPDIRYHAFLSYRRSNGLTEARLIQSELRHYNKEVFLDLKLDNGPFDSKIFAQIESVDHFILLLTPGSLDGCKSLSDWLRREIAYALQTDRNIIPVTFCDLNLSRVQGLPEDIRQIQGINAVKFDIHYFDYFIRNLINFMRPLPAHPRLSSVPDFEKESAEYIMKKIWRK
jgi:hypothetical protein